MFQGFYGFFLITTDQCQVLILKPLQAGLIFGENGFSLDRFFAAKARSFQQVQDFHPHPLVIYFSFKNDGAIKGAQVFDVLSGTSTLNPNFSIAS